MVKKKTILKIKWQKRPAEILSHNEEIVGIIVDLGEQGYCIIYPNGIDPITMHDEDSKLVDIDLIKREYFL